MFLIVFNMTVESSMLGPCSSLPSGLVSSGGRPRAKVERTVAATLRAKLGGTYQANTT